MATLPPIPQTKGGSSEDVTKTSNRHHSNSNLSLTSTGGDMESKMFTPETRLARSKGENIMVYVRIRPMNNFERNKHAMSAVDCPGTREVVVRDRNLGGTQKTFTYDRVFGPNSKQIDVYKAVVSPLLEEVLMGYNCTVFAYGQTGTGKTFTMEGGRVDTDCSWETDPLAGIVPRAMSQLFDELRVTNSEFTVRVSLLEMYNEEVYDLLSPCDDSNKPRTVRLYEDSSKKGSVTIQNLEEVMVHNKHDVYAIMERGSQIRKTASTLLNASSSRSHTVFTVTVHIKESSLVGEDLLKTGKLHLVDLAGSENIGRSGAVDKRAREAGNINQSLLTLGRVITALVEKAPHVPYRESKLTRLLQDSLGGRTKTSIIATISPASLNLEETLSTLDYAFRAKNIQNKPEVNQKLTKKAMLREYTEEIERLRKDLLAAREKNGVYVDKDNYDDMMRRIECQDQDLTEKIQCTKHLEEQILAKDAELKDVRGVLEETKDDLAAANALIDGLKNEISSLAEKLTELSTQKEEMEHLVDVRAQNEIKLRNEATTLLHTAADSTVKLDSLYTKLDRKKSVEASNYEAGTRFRNSFNSDLQLLANQVKTLQTQHAEFCGSQRLTIDEYMSKLKLMKDDISQHCTSVSDTLEDYHQQIFKGSGQLNEFWDSTYLLDMPTGATPPRKAYDFPRNLTTTSPHHRILARFRSRVQAIPESDSEKDKNDDYSSSFSSDDTSGDCLTSSESEITTPEQKENKAPILGENHCDQYSPEELSSNAKIDSLPSISSTNVFVKPEFPKPLSDSTKLDSKYTGGKNNPAQPIVRKNNARVRKGKKVLQTPNM